MPYAHITGWGISVPEPILTNDDIAKMVDTSDEWIRSRTGIRQRNAIEGISPERDGDTGCRSACVGGKGFELTCLPLDQKTTSPGVRGSALKNTLWPRRAARRSMTTAQELRGSQILGARMRLIGAAGGLLGRSIDYQPVDTRHRPCIPSKAANTW